MMTTSQQRFLIGLAAGAAAVLAGRRLARRRHAMDFSGRVVVITGGSSRATMASSIAHAGCCRRKAAPT